jgi:hypothetical protein
MKTLFDVFTHTQEHILAHGRAGSGKTYQILNFVAEYQKHTEYQGAVLLLAPTGIAAEHLNTEYAKGQTLDSFLWVSKKNPEAFLNFAASYSVIVIDEVSMIRDSKLQDILKLVAEVKYLKRKKIRLILVGDPFQLPPVVTPQDIENRKKEYGKADITADDFYFFKSSLFMELFKNDQFYCVLLSGSYRQRGNTPFLQLLDNVAEYFVTQDDLDILSSRLIDMHSLAEAQYPYVPMLVTGRDDVISINRLRLYMRLDEDTTLIFHTVSSNVEMSDSSVDPKTIRELLENEQMSNAVDFSLDMPILFVKNDRYGRWRNGTQGQIIRIERDSFDRDIVIIQKNDGNTVGVNKITVPVIASEFDIETRKIVRTKVAQITQYPFIGGYAFTIHKAQGLTLDEIIVSTGFGCFAPGQLYSALSRVRDLEHLHLLSPVKKSDIIPSDTVHKYWQQFLAKERSFSERYPEKAWD